MEDEQEAAEALVARLRGDTNDVIAEDAENGTAVVFVNGQRWIVRLEAWPFKS